MEGIGAEAASLAGHQQLANLCWIYDNNKITIEGATDLAFTEDVAGRFTSYGWAVQHVADANDLDALSAAFTTFKAEQSKPTLIVVDSVIGYGAPTKAGSHAAHGEPLGVEEIRGTKRNYGWPEDEQFLVPDGVRAHFDDGIGARGAELRRRWEASFTRYSTDYPELAKRLDDMQRRQLPNGWDTSIPEFPADPKGAAGRDANSTVLNAIAAHVPGSSAVPQTWPPPTNLDCPSTAPATSPRRTGPAGTCTSESANTPPEPSPTASR
jgi:transketolase